METVSDSHNEKEAMKEIKETIETEFQYFLMWRKKHGHEEPAVISCIGMETAAEREVREKRIAEEEEHEKMIRSEIRVREALEMQARVHGREYREI